MPDSSSSCLFFKTIKWASNDFIDGRIHSFGRKVFYMICLVFGSTSHGRLCYLNSGLFTEPIKLILWLDPYVLIIYVFINMYKTYRDAIFDVGREEEICHNMNIFYLW